MYFVYVLEENKQPAALILADPANSLRVLLRYLDAPTRRLVRVKTIEQFNKLTPDLDVWFPDACMPGDQVTFDEGSVTLETE